MNQSTEHPASVTYSLVTPSGFPILYTVRGESGTDLLEKMVGIDARLTKDGYTAQQKGGFQKREIQKEYANYPCPNCGAKVVKATTKTGKKLEKCENQKFVNGQTTGCSYTKWLQ